MNIIMKYDIERPSNHCHVTKEKIYTLRYLIKFKKTVNSLYLSIQIDLSSLCTNDGTVLSFIASGWREDRYFTLLSNDGNIPLLFAARREG